MVKNQLATWLRAAIDANGNNRSSARRVLRPSVEQLEDRTAPAVVTVTSSDDRVDATDGVVTLREAVNAIRDDKGCPHSPRANESNLIQFAGNGQRRVILVGTPDDRSIRLRSSFVLRHFRPNDSSVHQDY